VEATGIVFVVQQHIVILDLPSTFPKRDWTAEFELGPLEFLKLPVDEQIDPARGGRWVSEAVKRFGIPLLSSKDLRQPNRILNFRRYCLCYRSTHHCPTRIRLCSNQAHFYVRFTPVSGGKADIAGGPSSETLDQLCSGGRATAVD
jgi:hypothetical protein